LKQALSEADIIEHFQTFVRFKTGNAVSVGKMFSLLESKKFELYIMQYSIKQATV
jgi:ATP-binding cassette subfamily A (ABC1) protein 3